MENKGGQEGTKLTKKSDASQKGRETPVIEDETEIAEEEEETSKQKEKRANQLDDDQKDTLIYELFEENQRLLKEQDVLREEINRLQNLKATFKKQERDQHPKEANKPEAHFGEEFRRQRDNDETRPLQSHMRKEQDEEQMQTGGACLVGGDPEDPGWQMPKLTYIGQKLAKTTEYAVWARRIRTHIASRGAGWTIDELPEGRVPNAAFRREQTRASVADFIERHLENDIYRMIPETITRLKDPIAIFEYLDKTMAPVGQAQLVANRQELNMIRFDPRKEDVITYQTRFNSLCDRLRRYKVPEKDLEFGLQMSIQVAYPNIYEKWINAGERGMSLEETFARMRTEELHKADDKRRVDATNTKMNKEEKVMVAKMGDSDVCHNCGEAGHWKNECPRDEQKCFNCNEWGHIAVNCPRPKRGERREWSRSRERRMRPTRRDDNTDSRRGEADYSRWSSRGARRGSRGQSTQRRGRSRSPFRPKYKLMKRRDLSKENKSRKKEGRKELSMFIDANTCYKSYEEQYVYVDENQFEKTEQETARYANERRETAMRIVDGESQQENCYLYTLADSGASRHISKYKEAFVNLRKLDSPKRIVCANDDKEADLLVEYEGDVIICNNGRLGVIRDVLYAPNLSVNLFSIVKIVDTMNVTFTKHGVYLYDACTNELIKSGAFKGNCWQLKFKLPLIGASKKDRERMINEVYQNDRIGGSRKRDGKALTSADTLLKEAGGSKRKRVSFSDEVVKIDELCKKNEMKQRDLEKIESDKIKSLRDNIGMLWHLRLNHASYEYLKMATKVIPEMKGVSIPKEVMDCEHCILAKARRKPCTSERREVTNPFERVHTDLIGKITPMAYRSKEQYIVTFTDEVSRYAFSYSMRTKTEVHEALEDCLAEARRVKGNQYLKMHILRSDGGTEYKTDELKEIYDNEKITREASLPCVHQHNAKAERINLQIQRDVRVNLISAGMPAGFWKYALKHAINVYNRQPHSALNFRTPYEVFTGAPSKVKYIRRFGCAAYVLDESVPQGEKFEKRSNPGFLLNCDEDGYTVLLQGSNKVERSKNVDFIESKVYGDVMKEKVEKEIDFGETRLELPDCKECERGILTRNQARKLELLQNEKREREEEAEEKEVDKADEEDERSKSKLLDNNESSEPDHTQKQYGLKEAWLKVVDEDDRVEHYKNKNLDEHEANIAFFIESLRLNDEPANVKEALESRENRQWEKAMDEEFDSLERCGTWNLIDRFNGPKKPSVVDTKWVFKKKREAKGAIKFKGRCVARGFKDKNPYDVNEVYAPVARLSDVRFVTSSANTKDLELRQYDIKTAFLNGELDHPIYMIPPDGLYERERKRGNLPGVSKEEFQKRYLCELKRSIYGLRVSPKNWYTRFSATMKRLRFAMYPLQSSIFIWREKHKMAILLVYVDDILLASNDLTKIEEVERQLIKEYKLSSMGEPKMFLGIEIERDRKRGIIRLSQTKFIENILKRFKLDSAKDVIRTPMASHDQRRRTRESKPKMSENEVRNFPYRQIIGSLLYLQGGTRPDIAYAVNVLSRKQSNYDAYDCVEVKRILRYLKATKNLGLEYRREVRKEEEGIRCYVDASLGSNDEEGHSTSGYSIFLNNDLVIWRTKRQNHVALSSAEAEYVAMSLACRDVVALREMCKRILKEEYLPVLKEDSKPARDLALTEESKTLKHIVKLCYHYVRELARDKEIKIEWISTEEQIADFFTKPLEAGKFYDFRNELIVDLGGR